jgi:multidrug resistance efflux pump
MTKHMHPWVPILGFIGLTLGWNACRSKPATLSPSIEKIVETVYASGIVKSRQQYQVYPSLNGVIEEIFVHENDSVRIGDPILRIRNNNAAISTANARISAEYASTQANADKLLELQTNIDQAKANMDNNLLQWNRQKNLWANNIGTRNELDQRELAYTNAAKAYEAARLRYSQLARQISLQSKQAGKNLELAQSTQNELIVRSEVNGKVYNMLKEKGEMASTQTPVAIIGDAGHFYLELQVDEYDITRIQINQPVLITMDSYKGTVFHARITKIDPLMNERTRSFTVEAAWQNQPAVLYPNLTCEANIVIQEKEKALTIPKAYLLEGDSVLLPDKTKRKVKTGLTDYQKAEIIEGLNQGDVLIKPE